LAPNCRSLPEQPVQKLAVQVAFCAEAMKAIEYWKNAPR